MNYTSFFQRFADNLYTLKDVDTIKKKLSISDYKEDFMFVSDHLWDNSENQDKTSIEEFNTYKQEASHLLNRIKDNHTNKHNYFKLSYKGLGIAAIIIIAVAFTSLLQNLHFTTTSPNYISECTGIGEMKEIILPDGSAITLSSCSSIKYPERFSQEQRNIEFTGEAFFDVKRDEKRPFIVNTKYINIQVLGTSFNIKTHPKDVDARVFVKSGRVKVTIPNADVYLDAYEGLLFDTTSGDFSKYEQDSDESTWRNGILQFKETPLKDVINELERRYNYNIVYDEKLISGYSISGEHDNPNLESVLKSIEYTTGIKYKAVNSDTIKLYK